MATLEEERAARRVAHTAVAVAPRPMNGASNGVASYAVAPLDRADALPSGAKGYPARPWVEDEIAPVPGLTIPAPRSPIILVALQVGLDALMIIAAFALAYRLRFEEDILPVKDAPKPEAYIFMIGIMVATSLVVFAASGLYKLRRGASRIDEFYKIIAAVAMGTFGSIGVNYLLLGDGFVFSRAMLVWGGVGCVAFVTGERVAFNWAVGEARRRGFSRSACSSWARARSPRPLSAVWPNIPIWACA